MVEDIEMPTICSDKTGTLTQEQDVIVARRAGAFHWPRFGEQSSPDTSASTSPETPTGKGKGIAQGKMSRMARSL